MSIITLYCDYTHTVFPRLEAGASISFQDFVDQAYKQDQACNQGRPLFITLQCFAGLLVAQRKRVCIALNSMAYIKPTVQGLQTTLKSQLSELPTILQSTVPASLLFFSATSTGYSMKPTA